MSFRSLCLLMAPYVLLAAACIAAMILLRRPARVECPAVPVKLAGIKPLATYSAGFALCLLALFDVLSPLAVAAVTALYLALFDRALLRAVDYSLLGIFAAFFIFIGNISGIEAFRGFISSALTGRVELAAVLATQLTSNVPAALLLSGFTDQWPALIIGCNIGGLGTLIASMASLISYKAVAREYPEQKGRYFAQFTLCNLGLLAVMLGLSMALGAI